MVCRGEEFSRIRRQESMKRKQQQQQLVHEGTRQEVVKLQCNKGNAIKFKRSFFCEEDATSSAILLLACVVCAPSIRH